MASQNRASTSPEEITHPIRSSGRKGAVLALVLATTMTLGVTVSQAKVAPAAGVATTLAGGHIPTDPCQGCG